MSVPLRGPPSPPTTQALPAAASMVGTGAVPVDATASSLADRHGHIARAAVSLAQLAPELPKHSQELAEGAATQARQAHQLSAAAAAMTSELVDVSDQLGRSTLDAQKVIAVIERIARQTRILSINAAIEAARSGSAGSTAAVIAREVQALAQRTTDGTEQFESSITAIRVQAQRANAVAGRSARMQEDAAADGSAAASQVGTLDQLNARIRTIVEISAGHAQHAERLSRASLITRRALRGDAARHRLLPLRSASSCSRRPRPSGCVAGAGLRIERAAEPVPAQVAQ